MPKASPDQTSFTAGEVSPLIYGRTDAERYKQALSKCLNYIPTLQGPLVRRPGTKYVNDVKNSSQIPALIPFQFNELQGYMLEFGDQYIRFYTNEGQVITNTTIFKVSGFDSVTNSLFDFTGVRTTTLPNNGEYIVGTSAILGGQPLELVSPYSYTEVQDIKFAQNGDTIYLTHPHYPVYKLQRQDTYSWVLKHVRFLDGPYLDLNSYAVKGDFTTTTFKFDAPPFIAPTVYTPNIYDVTAGPIKQISTIASAGSSGWIRVTANAHGRSSGDSIVISGVVGTTEANNASAGTASWKVAVVDVNKFDLVNTQFVHAYTGSGQVFTAIFDLHPIFPTGLDLARNISVSQNGVRCWGHVFSIQDMAHAQVIFDPSACIVGTGVFSVWQMGVWKGQFFAPYQYPSCVTFHQNRMALSGNPRIPQEVDLSVTGDYERFAASGTNYQVTDANACQFNLNSTELNLIEWLASAAQGLLAGSLASEWKISPSSTSGALTATNVSATQTSFFGSANVKPVQAGNATLYVQKSNRKLREMNYFFQVDTFRSTDITELSEHITLPSITRLAVQKESIPVVWSLKSDGNLLSMSYNRDDANLKVGWAQHRLGGQSDAAGTNPLIKSMAVMAASSAIFDQLWMVVQRSVNSGSSSVAIEFMTRPYDDSFKQEDSYHFDYGITFDQPRLITNVQTVNGLAKVTSTSHGINLGSSVLITDVIGVVKQNTDINGYISQSSLLNEKTFVVASSTVNDFYLKDFDGNFISSSSYSAYISDGRVRKLVTHISGLTWLPNETIGVLADGKIHEDVVVSPSGAITLNWPAAKVQLGYRYNSDGATLRNDAGSATGSAIGQTRRITRTAWMLHNVGDFSQGPSFTELIPMQLLQADNQQADVSTALFSGIVREFYPGEYDFDDNLCFRQNSGLPGVIQSVTTMMEETDV